MYFMSGNDRLDSVGIIAEKKKMVTEGHILGVNIYVTLGLPRWEGDDDPRMAWGSGLAVAVAAP